MGRTLLLHQLATVLVHNGSDRLPHGRRPHLFQALLWPRMGFAASNAGGDICRVHHRLCALGIYSIALESVLMGFLALFI